MTATTTAQAPTTTEPEAPTVKEQAGLLQHHVAGYMAVRIIDIGLRAGLVEAIGARPGSTADAVADDLGLDPFYAAVWCRGAFGAGVLDRHGDGYRLAPWMDTVLLDRASPAYVGGLFPLVQQPEMFGRFADTLATGERMWWSDTSPDWIAGVAATGRPFYQRLVPGGLEQVPGLPERLAAGARIVDAACGSGLGLMRLAETFPAARIVGVDGDAHSIDRAAKLVADAGLDGRVELIHSPLEEMRLDQPATVVINNISMHECRDIDQVAAATMAALEPGGWFVISDFPFPDTDADLRTVPGRIMSGIQFFEAQIDDQLLPRATYDELLTRHGFSDIGSFTLAPVHAVTYGRRPS